MSAAKRAQLAAHWGSGTPFWERYVLWVQGVAVGDWGTSLRYNAPVIHVVGERFASSFVLMVSAWLLSGVLGVTLGIAAGAHRDGPVDRVVRGACIALSSTPAFWVGIVALMVFSVALGWFPIGFSAPIGASVSDISLFERVRHVPYRCSPSRSPDFPASPSIRVKRSLTCWRAITLLARARGESGRDVCLRHGFAI